MDKELLLIVVAVLGVSGAFFAKGKQTQAALAIEEAQMQLQLIYRLEHAHYLDTGRFVGFEQNYGAPLLGKGQCEPPTGARELGFKLRTCLQPEGHPAKIKYFYRIKLVRTKDGKDGFLAMAFSGSDTNGRNFACLHGQDTWTIDTQKQLDHVESCAQP